ncbi:WD repeat-containing protein 93 [Lamellibrachia satsuma]|nr:WD repeat-containing protein 93 [Lamellibrachia satsuma]
MPVYVRKSNLLTAPSLSSEIPDHDVWDFLQDPTLMVDQLPQPFRMVNKVVVQLVEDAWDTIADRENERITEAARYKPPQYKCGLRTQVPGKPNCMSASSDGKFIFVGTSDSLIVIEALTQTTKDTWKDDTMDIASLDVATMEEEVYLLSVINDLGMLWMFVFYKELIYPMWSLETEPDKKTTIKKCESSSMGDYAGIGLESHSPAGSGSVTGELPEEVSNHETWLDVYRLPRENWLRDLDSLFSAMKDRIAAAAAAAAAAAETESGDGRQSQVTPSSGAARDSQSSRRTGRHSQNSMSSMIPDQAERSQHKFAAPTVLLKVKPQSQVTGVNVPHKTGDSSHIGDVIGMGSNHVMSTQHLDQRQAVFEQTYQQHLKYLAQEDGFSLPTAMFHFLIDNRIVSTSPDSHTSLTSTSGQPSAGQPSSVVVWWSGQLNVMHYSLVKPSKESRADIVWPLSSPVVTSCVSPASEFLALALDNNNIIIWNNYFGVPSKTVHVDSQGKVTRMFLLDPSICQQEKVTFPPYLTDSNKCLLVVSSDGQMDRIPYGTNEVNTPSSEVFSRPEKAEEYPTMVKSLSDFPELIITCHQNGKVFIADIVLRKVLCEVKLPDSYSLKSPWQPSIASAGNGQMLYLQGVTTLGVTTPGVTTPGETTNTEEVIFVFTLRSFPSLDKYRQKTRVQVPQIIHTTLSQRVNMLFQDRMLHHGARVSRMQARWRQLRVELDVMKHLQECK